MLFKYTSHFAEQESFGCLVLFFPEGKIEGPPTLSPPTLRVDIARMAGLRDFTGKPGQTHVLPTPSGAIARLLCVGLGKAEELTREKWRRAAGTAGKALAEMNVEKAVVLVPARKDVEALGEVMTEGLLLGAYQFTLYKKQPKRSPETPKQLRHVTLHDPSQVTTQAAMKQGQARGEAICLARTLGNQPPNVLTPSRMATEARRIGKKRGMTVRVLGEKEMRKLGMGMLLGVAKGSSQPPRLIVMEYRPKGAKGTLAFVGKGITFDSGGISLKPGASMDEMKFDMCGAAAVLGAMDGITAFKPKVNIVAVVPTCENLPDGNSVKPGDILKAFNGKQVEILNTDAEGRLILGDALGYTIKKYKPDAVVDLATLTGACVVALGHYATGAVSNNDLFLEQVVAAGKESGDIVWPLPNFPEYGEDLKGKYADLQNIGAKEGGAISAGLFLKHFVDDVPWVHLDIAGTAWGVKHVGHIPYAGATGVGVSLLIDLARKWNGPK